MTAGMGLFGTLSGFLANKFLTPPAGEETPPTEFADADDPKARIAELTRLVEAQELTTADLKAELAEISELL